MSTITIHNVETGEIITREMNAEELAQLHKDQADDAAKLAADETKAVARAALLERIGITEEEARLLLGGN